MTYISHFNQQSHDYLKYRPDYPSTLYEYLASITPQQKCAWDCATGNGQAAMGLSHYFDVVLASDINFGQITIAPAQKSIQFICCNSEKLPFKEASVDLITIAQALHWLHLDTFYEELRRIAKPNSLIAAWCYSLGSINSDLDVTIQKLYNDILGDEYWPKERRYIDDGYSTISFPFEKVQAPTFSLSKEMDFNQFIGYLMTWSAIKEYRLRNKADPLEQVIDDLAAAWGDPQHKLTMHWPMHLLVGRV